MTMFKLFNAFQSKLVQVESCLSRMVCSEVVMTIPIPDVGTLALICSDRLQLLDATARANAQSHVTHTYR